MSGTGAYVTVAKVGEIPSGGVKVSRIGDQEIAVFNLAGVHYAMDDICTHDGGPLAEGTIEGHVIECPRHGARFDIRTGAVLGMPATQPVRTYPVRVDGDRIEVALSGTEGSSEGSNEGSNEAGASAPGAAPPAAAPAVSTSAVEGATAASAPTQQELAVRSALETVMDPEINLSVIDLGLIREIRFLDPPKTLIRMMLTTPFCPYAPQMIADVKQAVTSVVPQECEVEILPDAWSPDLMPDPGLLGFSY
ncbi:MAG: Rieske 2Fe-2S domain-containing protein [Candidatus Eiseniibacteriota bacterium]